MIFFKISLLLGLLSTTFSSPIAETRDDFDLYFNSVQWITRDGVVSLSIDHKSNLNMQNVNNDVVLLSTNIQNSFNILKSRFGSDSEWNNEVSLWNQYYCHAHFAASKNPWNIEPHRTTTSLFTTILNGCNPARFLQLILQSA